MKKMTQKIGLLLLSLLAFAPMRGQDTVTEGDNCYMFWPHTNTLWDPMTIDILSDNYFFEHIVDTGTLIYGVSLRGYGPLDSTFSISLAQRKDENYTFFDTVWVDSSVVNRYFRCRVIAHGESEESDFVDKCIEVYFHRPWLMTDTFYVVARFNNLYDDTVHYRTRLLCHSYDSVWPQRIGVAFGDGVPASYNPSPSPTLSDPTLISFPFWGFEFPILEPDRTRCRRPSGLRMRERGDGWAVLQWNSGSGDSYRVTVEGPDDTVVYETADTTLRLDSLAPEAFYWVKLQSLCRYQHYSYDSTLLNPGVLQFGFRNLITRVSGADADLRVEVYPNPASGSLVLEAGDDSPVRAVLTDLGGREVMAVDFRATATLDVSRLAAGPYLLRLTTPAATTVRKVVVQ